MSDLKKKYLQFIRKQEIIGEKFKDKQKQLTNFYLPFCHKIFKLFKSKNRPLLLSLSGGQGSGKSTVAQILKLIFYSKFKLNVVCFSIDDFYKTASERKNVKTNTSSIFNKRCAWNS